jgi:VIT1/CCC1 family predicted Fe2+/Mn2+ transporter
MIWTVRSLIALLLWIVAGLLTLFFIFSGWWIFAPFAFASGGGSEVAVLLLAIAVLSVAAYLIGRRRPT